MRVVALALAALLIVISGIWLARDRSNNSSSAQAPATESVQAEADQAGQAVAEQDQAASEPPPGSAPVGADGAGGVEGVGAAEGAASADQTAAEGEAGRDTEIGEGPEVGAIDVEPAPDESALATTKLPAGYVEIEYLTEEPKRVFDAPGEVLGEATDYVAVIETNRGDIVVDLYEDLTPETVNNFVFLALNRYYEGVPFHRVLEDFMAQTGDPTGSGSGGPGYTFSDEVVDNLVFDRAGLLAMANAGPGTNGSQFFITFDATPWLNGGHTIFGHVIEGEQVLDEITRVDPNNPSAIAFMDDTVASLAAQGVELPGEAEVTVAESIEGLLGTMPVAGQSFTVAGFRGAVGVVGNRPALGFFPLPDVMQSVVIGTRPK